MFSKPFKNRRPVDESGEESGQPRIQFLSLMYYIMGFLLGTDKSLKPSALAEHKAVHWLHQKYSSDTTEQKAAIKSVRQGFTDCRNSLRYDENTQLEYYDLTQYKENIRQYRRSLSSVDYSELYKQMLIYFIDYSKTDDLGGAPLHVRRKLSVSQQVMKPILQKTARQLGFTAQMFESLYVIGKSIPLGGSPENQTAGHKARYSIYPEAYVDACRQLAVNESETMQNIKRRYHMLLRENHPDKLASKNLSDDVIQKHTEITKTYHKAYQVIRQYHSR